LLDTLYETVPKKKDTLYEKVEYFI